MNYFLVNHFLALSFGQVTPDRQTQSDAYEPTVHTHRCAKKIESQKNICCIDDLFIDTAKPK